jgi:DNA topoisomerase I
MMFRIQKGRSVYFVDKNHNKIHNKSQLERIHKMRIPPAWKKVVVSEDPNAKVQAIGLDAKGRTQFIYSSKHIEASKSEKYKRVGTLGLILHKIIKSLKTELNKSGYTKDKVISLIIMLIILTSLRIGNDINRRLYNSFGLTTLQKQHISVGPTSASIKFIGKKGVENKAIIKDKFILGILRDWLKHFKPTKKDPIFRYEGKDGNLHTITAPDVNKFIKKFGPYTAKDFRTFNANVHLLCELDRIPVVSDSTKTQVKKNVTRAVKQVAKFLNNTPTICRKEYCSKVIIDDYLVDPIMFKQQLNQIKGDKQYGYGRKYERAAVYYLK